MATRICFWLDESMTNPEGHLPILVTENEAGYNPTTYVLPGLDFATAQAVVREWNAEMGVTPEDARDIVGSSIRLGNVGLPR
jgi:hypothetical protein